LSSGLSSPCSVMPGAACQRRVRFRVGVRVRLVMSKPSVPSWRSNLKTQQPQADRAAQMAGIRIHAEPIGTRSVVACIRLEAYGVLNIMI